MKLFPNQQKVHDTVIETSSNYFITGKPGVGKSVLINELVTQPYKRFTLSAPTGIAALNINGKTLHSIFRIPIFEGILEEDYNEFCNDDRVLNNIKYNIKHLIIDEISMVRADILDYIDRYLQFAKSSNLPFGGVQVVVVGDFFQLAPTTPPRAKAELYKAGYENPFAFSSRVWQTANFQTLILDEVRRQSDPKFIKLLHDAREGKISMEQCGTLNKRVGKCIDIRPTLCAINAQADAINKKELNKIDSPSISFNAKSYGKWDAKPVDDFLTLKIGAQVMVKKNNADVPLGVKDGESVVVNGTLGTVHEFITNQPKDATSSNTLTKIEAVAIWLENGDIINIYIQQWQKKEKNKNGSGDWEEIVVASYEQMPLALAWAISMHKSQGQSFDKVHIDPSKVFEDGQLYVALTRARSLAGVQFSSPVNTKKFKVNEHVKKFYKSLKNGKVKKGNS